MPSLTQPSWRPSTAHTIAADVLAAWSAGAQRVALVAPGKRVMKTCGSSVVNALCQAGQLKQIAVFNGQRVLWTEGRECVFACPEQPGVDGAQVVFWVDQT